MLVTDVLITAPQPSSGVARERRKILMPKRGELTISKRTVDALSVESRDTVFWDRDLPGFGVRVYPSGRKIFVVQSRGPAGIRRVAELAERYLREHVAVRCKPATAKGYRQVIGRNVVPALGKLPVSALGRVHVADLHYRLRKTPVAANEAVGALSRMLNRAEAWGLVPAGSNPCRYVRRYRTRPLERFLTEEEFRRLGETLDGLEVEGGIPVHAAAAVRLLMLTGCRCGEIVGLLWEDVHLDRNEIRLRDSKTGQRTVPLSPAAARVLAGLPRPGGNPWVVSGNKPGTRLTHIHYYWYRVRKRAGLDDVRIHDLRHSSASIGYRLAA